MRRLPCSVFAVVVLLTLLVAGCAPTFTPTLTPAFSPIPSPMISPTRTPRPTVTSMRLPTLTPIPPKPPTPTETLIPTPPVACRSAGTSTPLPAMANLTAADLLPLGAEFIADAVADVGTDGAVAAVIVYRSLGAQPGDSDDFLDSDGLHVEAHTLGEASYTPRGTTPDSPVDLLVVDLDGDGLREAVVLPNGHSALRFSHNGQISMPLVATAYRLEFEGGYMENFGGWDGFLVCNCPTLYLDGPKGISIADVDGDGLFEVDVAYSLEDGAASWQVDRYHWSGDAYKFQEALSRPADEAVSTEQYQAWAEALQPWPAYDRYEQEYDRIEFQVQQVLDVDVDGDGHLETAVSYLIRYMMDTDYADNHYQGYVGLALFDGSRLLWHAEPGSYFDGPQYLGLRPITLGAGQSGLLFSWLSLMSGTANAHYGLATLYRWDGQALVSVWSHSTMDGGRGGPGFAYHISNAFRLADVDGDGWNEILVRKAWWSTGDRYYDYTIDLPGEVAFHWDGDKYVPGYLIQEEELLPLRPRLPLFFAPRATLPLSLANDMAGWRQIEYWDSTGWYDPSTRLWRGTADIVSAWDQETIYVAAFIEPTQTLTLALDGDLLGDWNDTGLNDDDLVLQVALVNGDTYCRGPVEVSVSHPVGWSVTVKATAAQVEPSPDLGRTVCALQIAVPLDALGLDSGALVPEPGWCVGEEYTWDNLLYGPQSATRRQYYPRAGQAIGFAAALGSRESPVELSDPTGWGTLVFMADR